MTTLRFYRADKSLWANEGRIIHSQGWTSRFWRYNGDCWVRVSIITLYIYIFHFHSVSILNFTCMLLLRQLNIVVLANMCLRRLFTYVGIQQLPKYSTEHIHDSN